MGTKNSIIGFRHDGASWGLLCLMAILMPLQLLLLAVFGMPARLVSIGGEMGLITNLSISTMRSRPE
jgi:hypothetical protein